MFARFFIFFIFFYEIETQSEVDEENKYEQNEYYSIEYLEIISNYNYIMPCWSGVMLHAILNDDEKKEDLITRLENNTVENKFKIDKYSSMNHKKNNSPSSIVAKSINKIKVNSLMYNLGDSRFINEVLPLAMLRDEWQDKKGKGKSFYS
jgi:hypothetical protein